MKKDEFFAQLRNAFAGMDEELIMDILSDYENHFKEGMENGKSEEEICDELGNVEEIRQAFLDENPAAMTINVNSFVSNDSGAANKQSDSNIVFPINRVTDTNNTDDANFNSNSDTVGNSDIYDRFYPGIKRVNAQLTDADIEIKKSSTNDVELSVTGGLADDMEALKETLRVSASVGTLSIQQEKKAGISVSYAASCLFGLKVGKYSAGIVIHVAVPEQFEKIKVKSISGDIVANDISSGSFLVEAVSGDISVDQLNTKQCELNSKSGDIKTNNSSAKTLLIHTGSGDVGVEDCQADELLASSISGDVNVIACKADKMDVVSISGDIKAEFDKSAQCRAKSTSGDCKVTIGNQVDAVVSSTSGDVNVRYIGEIGLEMALSSTSGDVSAVCGGINSKGKKKVQERFGEPDSKLKASTISGDIKVRDC